MSRLPDQAALLDAGCGAALGQLLARLLPGLGSDSGRAGEAGALVTMALEVVTVLANPDVCLDPALPAERRAAEECLGVPEVSAAHPGRCDASVPCTQTCRGFGTGGLPGL